MALFNEILSGRINRGLQKMLSMKGSPPAPQLGGEIVPAIGLFYGVECRYLEGWHRYANENVVAAAATFVSGVRLRNPANSGVVAVIEKVLFDNENGAANVFVSTMGVIATDLGTILSPGPGRIDARGNQNSSLVLSFQNNAASITGLTTGLYRASMPANTSFDAIVFEEQEPTILPGDGIQVQVVAVNNACGFSLVWRERSLEDSEKQ